MVRPQDGQRPHLRLIADASIWTKPQDEETYKGDGFAAIKPSVVAKESANNTYGQASHGDGDNGFHVFSTCAF